MERASTAILAAALAFSAAACCAPPRIDDRSTPDKAYLTFRDAVSHDEVRREYECLSPHLRRSLSVRSPADWSDLRAIVLTSDHLVIRGIKSSDPEGEPRVEGKRAELDLSFPFGIRGRVWLTQNVVVQVRYEGSDHPPIYGTLETLDLVFSPSEQERAGPVIGVAVSQRQLDAWREQHGIEIEEGRKVRAVEIKTEWFLDGFEIGGETPESVSESRDQKADQQSP